MQAVGLRLFDPGVPGYRAAPLVARARRATANAAAHALADLDRLNAFFLAHAAAIAIVAVAVATLAGLDAVFTWGISERDEVFIWSAVRSIRAHGDLTILAHRVHAPLSYLLFAGLARGAQPSELVLLRLLNVALYGLAAALVVLLARRARPLLPAAPAVALAAVPHYHDVFEARAYPLYALLGLAAVLGACATAASDRRAVRFAGLALFGVASLGAVYTHPFASFLIASIVIGSFWANGIRSSWSWSIAAVAAAAIALFLPWLPVLIQGREEVRLLVHDVDGITLPVRLGWLVVCWCAAAALVWRAGRLTPAVVALCVFPFVGWMIVSWPFVIAAWAHLERRRNGLPTPALWKMLIAYAALPELVQTDTGFPFYHLPSVMLRALIWASMLASGRGSWTGRIATLVVAGQICELVTTALGYGLSNPIGPNGPWPGLLTSVHAPEWLALKPW